MVFSEFESDDVNARDAEIETKFKLYLDGRRGLFGIRVW
jgi:hypothetical protein